MTNDRPAIALVPGFLGFDHRTSTSYFADRFIAGLRCALAGLGARGVPVVPVSTLPIASLKDRQTILLQQLEKLSASDVLGPRRWHLIGHSTGGVDAALLLREHPLVSGADGSAYDERGWGGWGNVVSRIASVTSIAAPHWGTTLAECPIAKLVEGHPSLAAVRDAALIAVDAARRDELSSRLEFALGSFPAAVAETPKFLADLLFKNALARDLRPAVSVALANAPVREDAAERIFSVITCAPRPSHDHEDKLFRDLWTWTRDGAGAMVPAPPGWAKLDERSLRLESQAEMSLPAIADTDNDGVVNTARQLFGEPIALVVGDHADVLGRYRRTSLGDDKLIDPGLLTSGASFGDDAFFDLVLRIARRLEPILA